jgi:hypothetical protein
MAIKGSLFRLPEYAVACGGDEGYKEKFHTKRRYPVACCGESHLIEEDDHVC